MLNKLRAFLRQQKLIASGDTVICAVSGGADSVALLFALYLLKEELNIRLEAAHFNHQLRGAESDADEAFVREFCDRYEIPLHVGTARVTAGKKGLEAAARDARYAFFATLSGKIATAHTADDNAETVLLHLVRGTGLRGLGGITPLHGKLIRPMLLITRQDVEEFNREWCLSSREDSSNHTDAFLRNRLRHHVMPLLKQENPRLAENLSRTALGLRQDEACLASLADYTQLPGVEELKGMAPAIRSRMLADFLRRSGVPEPEQSHIAQAESLVFSERPSAKARFPGSVTIARRYDRLVVISSGDAFPPQVLNPGGWVDWGDLRIHCREAGCPENTKDSFTVVPRGTIVVRSRQSGDAMRLSGGTKSLKKCFIDRKIPADCRERIPVIADEEGVLGVYSMGVNLDRLAVECPAVTITIKKR